MHGYELNVFRRMVNIIEKFNPVVAIELKNSSTR